MTNGSMARKHKVFRSTLEHGSNGSLSALQNHFQEIGDDDDLKNEPAHKRCERVYYALWANIYKINKKE